MSLDPEATEHLFAYGTLQTEAVQLATFGRRLEGKADALIGYRLTTMPTQDQNFAASSGATHHRTLQSTSSASDLVEGTVFKVTKQDLDVVDSYEPIDYKRLLVQLRSGINAWVYVNAHTETSNITIRQIDTLTELRAVEELQKEVWGIPDLDVVPLTHLIAAKAAGGVLLGAFDRETLVGFVYGFLGLEDGEMAHHSHMLAVKPAYRNFNLGYRLKLAQREAVLAQGVNVITWTFDPLQSLNAYFNFNKLGVLADRYLINFYGEEAASFLHQSGTDRLWVKWLLTSERVIQRLDNPNPTVETPANKLSIEIP